MSIWTSKPTAFVLIAALAGCVGVGGFSTPRSAPVLGGALNVGVPAGYCVDRKASREKKDSAVILMGRCADNLSAAAALVTVSVGPGGSAGVMTAGGPALAAFFKSPQGRATLSRDGRASDVRVLQAIGVGTALLLHLTDREQGEYWRAVVGMSGRLVTISASGTEESPLPPELGRKLVDQSLAALTLANPAPQR